MWYRMMAVTMSFWVNLKDRHTDAFIFLSRNRIVNPVSSLHASISFDNIETSSLSLAGVDPDSAGKVNQDVCFHFCEGRFVCCGVLDGHGKKGHILNEFLRACMPTILKSKLKADKNPVELTLKETFEDSHLAARMDTDIPAGRSGTTCIVTVLDVESAMLYTGNVGDSSAIKGVQQKSGWNIEALNKKTTTARQEERERIEQGEGRIDGAGNVWYGPVGIAMTRALGDSVMTRASIIPTPEVTKLDLRDELDAESERANGLIVLGSDGIFDVMSDKDVIDSLSNSLRDSFSLDSSCSVLVEEARRRWQNGLPLEVRIDDTTSVVFSFRITRG